MKHCPLFYLKVPLSVNRVITITISQPSLKSLSWKSEGLVCTPLGLPMLIIKPKKGISFVDFRTPPNDIPRCNARRQILILHAVLFGCESGKSSASIRQRLGRQNSGPDVQSVQALPNGNTCTKPVPSRVFSTAE